MDDIFNDLYEGHEVFVASTATKKEVDNRTPTEKFLDEVSVQRQLIDDPHAVVTAYEMEKVGKRSVKKLENGKPIPKTYKECWWRSSDNTWQVKVGVKGIGNRIVGVDKNKAHTILNGVESKAKSGALDALLNKLEEEAQVTYAAAAEARSKATLVKLVTTLSDQGELNPKQRKRMKDLIKEHGHPDTWDE